MKQHILALAAAMLLSGCATIVGTETQSVLIDSQPPGARFTVQDENGRPVAEGYTPKTVILEKSNHRYFGKKTLSADAGKSGLCASNGAN